MMSDPRPDSDQPSADTTSPDSDEEPSSISAAGGDTVQRSDTSDDPGHPQFPEPDADDETVALRKQVAELQDRALRIQAELENTRKRGARELSETRRYAAVPVLRDLLPVIDNSHRAIAAAEQTQDVASLMEGFKLLAQQLENLIKQQGCERIEALNQPFDPSMHEAISQLPSADHPPMTVMHEVLAGYQLGDRVVRASQVVVSSGSPTISAADPAAQPDDAGGE